MWHRLLHLVTKRTSLRLLRKYLEVWFKSKHITHKFRTEVYLPSMLNDKKNMTSHGRTRHMSTMWYILRTLRDFSTYTPSLSSPQYLYLVLCWVHITLFFFCRHYMQMHWQCLICVSNGSHSTCDTIDTCWESSHVKTEKLRSVWFEESIYFRWCCVS